MTILQSIFSPITGGSQGTPYQQFGSDTFTDTNGTAITAHTNDALVAWTQQTGISSATPALINNNRVYSTNTNNTYTSNFIPNNADYEVYGKFYKFSAGTAGITARASTSAETYYCLRYDGIGWQINRMLNGVSAQIGNAYLDDWADGTEREVVLWLQGITIKAFVNGTEVISTADFLITDAGRGGITLRTPSTTSTGIHLDTFQVRQPVLNPSVLLSRDDFTDTNGTILRLHALNSGESWVRVRNATQYADNVNPIIHNNNLVITNTNQQWRPNTDLTTNDYEILFSATRVSADTTTSIFICGRVRGTIGATANLYQLRYNIASQAWILSRNVDGVFGDSLATYADTGFTSGTSRRGRFIFKGSSIQVYIDDVLAMNFTNTTASTGDTYGFESAASGTPPTTTTGLHIERLSLHGIVQSNYNNLYDGFNNANGTTLNTHRLSESGYLWITQAGTTITTHGQINNNRFYPLSVNNVYQLNYEMQTANYEVEATFVCLSNTGNIGITARASSSVNTYYAWIYNSNTFSLIKVVAGTLTTLATFPQTLSVNQSVKATLRCYGAIITGLIDGVVRAVVTDTDITSAGRIGIRAVSAVTTTTGVHIENIISRAV